MLLRGASPYDVAKILGDTVKTVEDHYASFVRELRERARRLMDNSEGLESTGTVWAQSHLGEGSRSMKLKEIAADESVSRILSGAQPSLRWVRW